MSKRKTGCPRLNSSARKSPRLLSLLLSLLWLQCAFHCPDVTARGRRQPPAQSTPQQQSAGAQNEQVVTTLELGKPIEREVMGGQKHSYQVVLSQGQYVKVEVKPRGIGIGMSIQLPGGKPIPVIDPPGMEEEPMIQQVAESSGVYWFSVYTKANAAPGSYEIRIAELRPATENERAMQQARNLTREVNQLKREGRLKEARPQLILILEIREKVLGPEHLGVASALGSLSTSYQEAGDYASAELLQLRALNIKKKVLGPEHTDVADELHSLGILYQEKGDHIKAEALHQQALRIYEKANRTENQSVVSTLSSLGGIYSERGDYQSAERYFERARATREKLLGPDHFHLAASFVELGDVAYAAGDYAKAEAMFQRALTLYEKTVGRDHIRVTRRLNELAMLYRTTGDYAKAEALYERALSIHEQKWAIIHPDAQETLFGLARLHTAQGMLSEAVKDQIRASEIEERYIELNLGAGSEREKLAFLANLSSRSSQTISLHIRLAPDDPAARNLAVTTILRRKGRVQDAMSETIAALHRRFGAEDQKVLDQFNDVTSKLAKLVLNGPQKAAPSEHQEQIKNLDEERERLEAEISSRSAGFYERSQSVTLAAVQQAIPADAALIEFAVYRPFDPKAPDNQKAYGEPRYVAYVVRNQGDVQWKELGEAKDVDQGIEALRQALFNPKRNSVKQVARAADERVMQPVRAMIGDAAHLLVSPDGQLNLIPFEALVDEQQHYLVERYDFTYLTSGRDLLRMKVARESKSQPVVVADPAFGEPVIISSRNNGRSAPAKERAQIDYSQIFFGPLPGIGDEVRALRELLPQAIFLTKERATKTALKRLNGPLILHIATHGFFFTNDPQEKLKAATQAKAGTRVGRWIGQVENPLLRSGLALAGANQGPGGSDNGVLTAFEATGLNLWGTKLVVLSACDTGLGEVKNGEGVYGLRRAFLLAGAESLMMSLWPVSDRSTRDLMIGYYKRLVQNEGRSKALRQVQLQLLRSKSHSHPYYWASFIQTGEWANLQGKR